MAYNSEIDLLKAVFSLLIALLVINILYWAYNRLQKLQLFKKCGIPGPQPEFFRGNMHQLRAAKTPNDAITSWLKQYGNVFGYYIGEKPHLIVNDLDLLKQAMIKDFHYFTNRPDMFIDIEPLIYTVIALKDQRWKEVRSVLTPTFSASKIRLMTKIVNQKVSTLLESVNEKANKDEMFDIYKLVQGLTLDVIGDCALAMKTNCQKDPDDPFLIAVREFFLHAHNVAVEYAIIFPFIASIMKFVAKYLTAGKMTSMIVKNVKEVISIRRKNPTLRGVDILQLMLDAAETKDIADTTSTKKTLLTDDEIIANAYVFLLAGYETTATALAFTFYLLIKHPEIQDKLNDEIMSMLPNKEDFSYDDVQELQYMDQVFNESLRIYPPVTGFITRQCQHNYTLGDVTVPEGTILQAPIWNIHHDPKLWPDPWKFDPERFSPEKKGKMHPLSFLPFGVGQRNCIGMRFAQLEAKLALARLVQKFKFIPCEKTDDPITLTCPTVIINPAKGVFIKAIPRDLGM